MKNNGYVLFELIISSVIVFIVLINITNMTLTLTKKMNNIYINNNINAQIDLISNKIGYDLYDNSGKSNINCTYKTINGKQLKISNNNLIYGTTTYSNKNIKFNNVSCESKTGYYKIKIEYNDENIELYSLKKVS